jgi:hypothetical protein
MRTVRLAWVCLLGLVVLAGCQPSQEGMIDQLGPASPIVSASIANLGWSRAASNVHTAHFTAIVTTYDETGKSFTDRQEMVVDLAEVSLASSGGTPQGAWKASIDNSGQCEVVADLGVDTGAVCKRMAPTLRGLLRRIRGPYNILGDERPLAVDPMRVAGHDVVRVSLGADTPHAVAYYFEASTALLKYVTTGADRAGGKGSITEYEYQSLPNGVLFPSRIKVAHLGQFVLVGEKPILEVEISNVTF